MKNSYTSYGVYCLFNQVSRMLSSKKLKEDFDIYHLIKKERYNNAPDSMVKQCKRIFNEIYNHYYSYRKMVLYMLYYHLVNGKKPSINQINEKNIREMMRLFSKTQYKKDKQLVYGVFKKNNIEDRQEKIKSLIPLIKLKYISPMFFIDIIRRNILTERDEHDIFIDEDLKRFLFIMKQINKTFTEVNNEQKKVRN